MDASPGPTPDRRIAAEQAALRRVAVLVAGGAPPEEVFSAVAEEVGRLLEVDFATLARYDPQDAITIAGTWTRTGAPSPTPVGNRLRLGGRNLTTLVYRTGRPQRIDYDDVSGAIGDTAARDWGLRSSAGVPIRVEGRLWGAMLVAFTREEPLPADAEARLAGFTELVATAVANAQARTELRGFAEEQAALRRVATLVAERGADVKPRPVRQKDLDFPNDTDVTASRPVPDAPGDPGVTASWARKGTASRKSELTLAAMITARRREILEASSLAQSAQKAGVPVSIRIKRLRRPRSRQLLLGSQSSSSSSSRGYGY